MRELYLQEMYLQSDNLEDEQHHIDLVMMFDAGGTEPVARFSIQIETGTPIEDLKKMLLSQIKEM